MHTHPGLLAPASLKHNHLPAGGWRSPRPHPGLLAPASLKLLDYGGILILPQFLIRGCLPRPH